MTPRTFLEKDAHHFKQLFHIDFVPCTPDITRISDPEEVKAFRAKKKLNVRGTCVWHALLGYGKVTEVFEGECRELIVGAQFESGTFEIVEVQYLVPTSERW